MSLPYEYVVRLRFRSVPHIPLSRGDRYVSASWISRRGYVGHRAVGSLDQREAVDRAMGQGSHTVWIHVNNPRRNHPESILGGCRMSTCFIMENGKQVRVKFRTSLT